MPPYECTVTATLTVSRTIVIDPSDEVSTEDEAKQAAEDQARDEVRKMSFRELDRLDWSFDDYDDIECIEISGGKGDDEDDDEEEEP